ncbi:hypothetical protein EJV46_00920 [Roseococcus sp. SYP-B2431]|uniref:hypothetical protein n=1 Tax=Roseococcus sp. SYP-B2431 TaxID=2496640 RepID=UPI0010390299|nr:hypothetical protein [Roseococcus sp. SYP-B2431]TCI00774.1 hypothetical protein EJV46_00920 [Roseococcus sp. SYP-B2431]
MGNPVPEWTSATGEPLSHAIGRLGEREAAFFLGQEGWVVLYGPGGSQRFPRSGTQRVHQPTTKGLDLIAFNPKDGSVLILDNKAGGGAHVVNDVSAFTSDLAKKLKNRITKLERGRAHLPPWALKDMDRGIAALKEAEQALAGKGKWPSKVRLAISNAAGNATGLSKELAKQLADKGIHFIDVNAAKKLATPSKVRRGILRATAHRLRQKTAGQELKALEKLAGRRVAGAAGRAGVEALEKAAAKATGKALLRAGAKAAARRTMSLLPVVGWGFSAKDAVAGVEDILRGHTARGLAGIGMAVADVGSDLVHVGNAVSGVGGTALSLGLQGALVAGQLGIEMDRMKDKMEELQKEIRDKGRIPDDRHLRDEFGLDEEAIADLKKSIAEQDSSPPTPDDLPPPPDWGQEWDMEWPEPPPPPPHHAPGKPVPPPAAPTGPNAPFWNQPIA